MVSTPHQTPLHGTTKAKTTKTMILEPHRHRYNYINICTTTNIVLQMFIWFYYECIYGCTTTTNDCATTNVVLHTFYF